MYNVYDTRAVRAVRIRRSSADEAQVSENRLCIRFGTDLS